MMFNIALEACLRKRLFAHPDNHFYTLVQHESDYFPLEELSPSKHTGPNVATPTV